MKNDGKERYVVKLKLRSFFKDNLMYKRCIGWIKDDVRIVSRVLKELGYYANFVFQKIIQTNANYQEYNNFNSTKLHDLMRAIQGKDKVTIDTEYALMRRLGKLQMEYDCFNRTALFSEIVKRYEKNMSTNIGQRTCTLVSPRERDEKKRCSCCSQ